MGETTSQNRRGSIKLKLIVVPLVIVLVAILGIGGISSYLTRSSLLQQMRNDGLQHATQIANQIETSTISMETMSEMIQDNITIVSRTVIRNQENLSNQMLRELGQDLGVDEINLYNEEGEIIYSNLQENIGWIAPEDHSAQAFVNGSQDEFMEEIRQSAVSDDHYQYGYIRSPEGGFVQVGILANTIYDISERFSIQNLVEDLAQDEGIVFALFIDRDLRATAHSNRDRIGIELTDGGSRTAAVEGQPYTSEFPYEVEGTTINVYDVVVPVIVDGEHVGAINMGLSMANVHTAIQQNFLMVGIIGIILFIILGIILFKISNHVIKSLNTTKEHLNFIASGDLTKEVPEENLVENNEFGEIAHAIKNMQHSLKEMILNIVDTSQQVTSSSEELTATSQQSATAADEVAKTIEEMAKGANDQARDAEEGAVHINGLAQLIEKDQLHIKNLNTSTDKVSQLKDEGMESLKDLVEKTNSNNKSTKEIHEVIINTNESAEKIQNSSQMIRSIAEQTNLLALNAAIEAARAGEAGRGFAVVAEEIRKLAEQSSQFTEEIGTIIHELISKTGQAVNTMQAVSKSVESQTKSVEITNTKFEGINNAIEQMKEAIAAINTSGEEMENKKDEIIAIIENLSATSEQNAAGTEEASASIEEQTAAMEEIANASEALANLAEEMQKSVTRFKY